MKRATLIFPHQLYPIRTCELKGTEVFLVEENLFFNQYNFHKQKLAFHRASMKAYASEMTEANAELHYIESADHRSDIRILIDWLAAEGFQEIYFINPTDDWLSKRISSRAKRLGLKLVETESPNFINSGADLQSFFRKDKKSFFQTSFYKQQRESRNVLMDGPKAPTGGKWSFDSDNRKPWPKGKPTPEITYPQADDYWNEALGYIGNNFSNNLGEVSQQPLYPYTRSGAQAWLNTFFEQRFNEFGDYEDAIVRGESILNHSVLTPMLNVGLLNPLEVVSQAVQYAEEHGFPINSTEGFVRQIIGWREFIRGMYLCKGVESRTTNFWGFERKIPASFYDGTTGVLPVDETIKGLLRTGYCHHIERLMVLGNFMVLCEFDPDEVYRWFMELFIDAYDWVMVPNVYGMSQFADGGLFATKPYISSSNYIMKMSNYPKGDWNAVWDGLFWRFISVNRDFFGKNPRLNMMVRTLDKMNPDRRESLLSGSEDFLNSL